MLHWLIPCRSGRRLKLPPAERKYGKAGRTWNKICPEVESNFHVRSCDVRVPLFRILRKGEWKQLSFKSFMCHAWNIQTRAHLLKFAQKSLPEKEFSWTKATKHELSSKIVVRIGLDSDGGSQNSLLGAESWWRDSCSMGSRFWDRIKEK